MLRKLSVLLLMCAGLTLFGCASADRTFLLDLSFAPQNTSAPKDASLPVIALNRLSDSRSLQDKTLIGDGVNPAAKRDSFYLHGERPEVLLTDALEDHLRAAGFEVKRIFGWDRNPATVNPAWGDVIMGGELLDFWLETDNSAFHYNAKARTKIRVSMVNAATRDVLFSSIVEKTAERSGGLMKKEDLEDLLSDVYSGVVEQVIQDQTVKERLRGIKK